jgi:hypothetical protein
MRLNVILRPKGICHSTIGLTRPEAVNIVILQVSGRFGVIRNGRIVQKNEQSGEDCSEGMVFGSLQSIVTSKSCAKNVLGCWSHVMHYPYSSVSVARTIITHCIAHRIDTCEMVSHRVFELVNPTVSNMLFEPHSRNGIQTARTD